MQKLSSLVAVAGLLAGVYACAQDSLPWQSANAGPGQSAASAVRYEYPEQVTVAAGRPSTVELHFRIRDGLHINSHTPLEKSLIRTELEIVEPAGVTLSAVDFPAGSSYALKAMPGEKLSVYTGELVLQAHLTATRGEHLVQAALRYQACDSDSCYPPKKAPAALDIVAK